MSVSRGGDGVSTTDGLNWATVADQTADTDGTGKIYNVDVDLPDQHVMALHAIRVTMSDRYDAQEGQGEWWVYADDDAPAQNSWIARAENADDLIFHSNLGWTATGAGGNNGNAILIDSVDFPLPVLRGSGELVVNQSGTNPSGGDLEWVMHFYYDVVPAESTDAYLELLLKQ